jgi:hypothetical protein
MPQQQAQAQQQTQQKPVMGQYNTCEIALYGGKYIPSCP